MGEAGRYGLNICLTFLIEKNINKHIDFKGLILSLRSILSKVVMSGLKEYLIPIKGWVKEKYSWSFQPGVEFFKHFEKSPIQKAEIEVKVDLEKKPSLMIFYFDIQGKICCQCDRCLEEIMLPVAAEFQLMVKTAHSLEQEEVDGDDEIVFISAEDSHFDLSSYVYEFACLSLPIKKVYSCEEEKPPPCNFKILDKLKVDEMEDQPPTEDSIWEQIKKNLNY